MIHSFLIHFKHFIEIFFTRVFFLIQELKSYELNERVSPTSPESVSRGHFPLCDISVNSDFF